MRPGEPWRLPFPTRAQEAGFALGNPAARALVVAASPDPSRGVELPQADAWRRLARAQGREIPEPFSGIEEEKREFDRYLSETNPRRKAALRGRLFAAYAFLIEEVVRFSKCGRAEREDAGQEARCALMELLENPVLAKRPFADIAFEAMLVAIRREGTSKKREISLAQPVGHEGGQTLEERLASQDVASDERLEGIEEQGKIAGAYDEALQGQARILDIPPRIEAAVRDFLTNRGDLEGLAEIARLHGVPLPLVVDAVWQIASSHGDLKQIAGRSHPSSRRRSEKRPSSHRPAVFAHEFSPTDTPFSLSSYRSSLLQRASLLKQACQVSRDEDNAYYQRLRTILEETENRIRRDWAEWRREFGEARSEVTAPVENLLSQFFPGYVLYAVAHYGRELPTSLDYIEWVFLHAAEDFAASHGMSGQKPIWAEVRHVLILFLSGQPSRRGVGRRNEAHPDPLCSFEEVRSFMGEDGYGEFRQHVLHELSRHRLRPYKRSNAYRHILQLLWVYIDDLLRLASSGKKILSFVPSLYQEAVQRDFGAPYSRLCQEIFLKFFEKDIRCQRLDPEDLVWEQGRTARGLEWEGLQAAIPDDDTEASSCPEWSEYLLHTLDLPTFSAGARLLDAWSIGVQGTSVFHSWGGHVPDDWRYLYSLLTYIHAERSARHWEALQNLKPHTMDPYEAYQRAYASQGPLPLVIHVPQVVAEEGLSEEDLSLGAFLAHYLDHEGTNHESLAAGQPPWISAQSIAAYVSGTIHEMREEKVRKLAEVAASSPAQRERLLAYLFFVRHFGFFKANFVILDRHKNRLFPLPAYASRHPIILEVDPEPLKPLDRRISSDFQKEPLASVLRGLWDEWMSFIIDHAESYSLTDTKVVEIPAGDNSFRKFLYDLCREDWDPSRPSDSVSVTPEGLKDMLREIQKRHIRHSLRIRNWFEGEERVSKEDKREMVRFYEMSRTLFVLLLTEARPVGKLALGWHEAAFEVVPPTRAFSCGARLERVLEGNFEISVVAADLLGRAGEEADASIVRYALFLRVAQACLDSGELPIAFSEDVSRRLLEGWGATPEEIEAVHDLLEWGDKAGEGPSWETACDALLASAFPKDAGKKGRKDTHTYPTGLPHPGADDGVRGWSVERLSDVVFGDFLRSWWRREDVRFVNRLPWDPELAASLLEKRLSSHPDLRAMHEAVMACVHAMVLAFNERSPLPTAQQQRVQPTPEKAGHLLERIFKNCALPVPFLRSALRILVHQDFWEKGPISDNLREIWDRVHSEFEMMGVSAGVDRRDEKGLEEFCLCIEIFREHWNRIDRVACSVPVFARMGDVKEASPALGGLFRHRARLLLLEPHPPAIQEIADRCVEDPDQVQREIRSFLLIEDHERLWRGIQRYAAALGEALLEQSRKLAAGTPFKEKRSLFEDVVLALSSRIPDWEIPHEASQEPEGFIRAEIGCMETLALMVEVLPRDIRQSLTGCLDLMKSREEEAQRREQERQARVRAEREEEERLRLRKEEEDRKQRLAQQEREEAIRREGEARRQRAEEERLREARVRADAETARLARPPVTREDLAVLSKGEVAPECLVARPELLRVAPRDIPDLLHEALGGWFDLSHATNEIAGVIRCLSGGGMRDAVQVIGFCHDYWAHRNPPGDLKEEIENFLFEAGERVVSQASTVELREWILGRYDAIRPRIWGQFTPLEKLGLRPEVRKGIWGVREDHEEFRALIAVISQRDLPEEIDEKLSHELESPESMERIAAFCLQYEDRIFGAKPMEIPAWVCLLMQSEENIPEEPKALVDENYPELHVVRDHFVNLHAGTYLLWKIKIFVTQSELWAKNIQAAGEVSGKVKRSLAERERFSQELKALDKQVKIRANLGWQANVLSCWSHRAAQKLYARYRESLIRLASDHPWLLAKWIGALPEIAELPRPSLALYENPDQAEEGIPEAARIANRLLEMPDGDPHYQYVRNALSKAFRCYRNEKETDYLWIHGFVVKTLLYYWRNREGLKSEMRTDRRQAEEKRPPLFPELAGIPLHELDSERYLAFQPAIGRLSAREIDFHQGVRSDVADRLEWVVGHGSHEDRSWLEEVRAKLEHLRFQELLGLVGIEPAHISLIHDQWYLESYSKERKGVAFETVVSNLTEIISLFRTPMSAREMDVFKIVKVGPVALQILRFILLRGDPGLQEELDAFTHSGCSHERALALWYLERRHRIVRPVEDVQKENAAIKQVSQLPEIREVPDYVAKLGILEQQLSGLRYELLSPGEHELRTRLYCVNAMMSGRRGPASIFHAIEEMLYQDLEETCRRYLRHRDRIQECLIPWPTDQSREVLDLRNDPEIRSVTSVEIDLALCLLRADKPPFEVHQEFPQHELLIRIVAALMRRSSELLKDLFVELRPFVFILPAYVHVAVDFYLRNRERTGANL